ncbi:prepilin-type N-terminal cleavage/methylation domain-containing protein [Shewanella inventionis]|uniref:MSHA biogenesis protein MshB n=1 Tax=Shewanella inventionis TaxID=1738770 RepID=A0ABQ1JC54_9GAMM|nr:prepilin-type N-terminal cleavage/methylation domain-containing protein [Shewanella inventionis]MCL1157993.1 prepilin-type N-terminal cleavage/methylation domain-containing protein [Shewanella inventionis]UAL44064.1 prepilin-type N-terminal cleavage/methylation domain-containing protein [Shewanella inventionis]GGB62788.1 MSHA biogenesis protein MshB [Shewanella inventionis]
MKLKQQGFSLIELVIVIVILGLLAATAIPRFLNVTDDAEDASVDGVAGGLATAVSFVRAQWEVDGRSNTSVVLDGTTVSLDTRFGFPTGTTNTSATAMTNATCQEVFDSVLQNAPRNVLFNQDASDQRYTVRVQNAVGGSSTSIDGATVNNLDLCVYHQVASLTLNQTSGVPTPTPDLSTSGAKGVTYNPGTGQVVAFSNN